MADQFPVVKIVWIVNDRYVNNFATVYRECQKNPKFKMIVVAAPHLSYDFAPGNTSAEIFNYLTGQGISCADSFDAAAQTYIDISRYEPDYIFTTTPYDMYLPEPYRSYNLMKIAKLCSVEYGAVIAEWTNIYITLANNPFLVNCWKIFTTNTHDTDSDKFQPVGNLKLDEYVNYGRNCNKLAKWYKTPGKRKMYRVIWKPRWTVAENDSNLIRYLDDFYHYISNNQDMDFVLLEHPFLMTNADKMGYAPTLIKYLESFQQLPNFRLENSGNFLDYVLSADVLIADHSSTIAEFAVTGKPIIFTPTDTRLNEFGRRIIESSYTANSFAEITQVLDRLKKGRDPYKKQRENRRLSYFFVPPDNMSVANYLLLSLYTDYENSHFHK